jgi:GxxExxY protein
MNENQIGNAVIDAAIAVHRELGPGLLESVYETILAYELTRCGLNVRKQVPMTIEYKGYHFDEGFRADLLVNEMVLLELKSVETIANVHKKQLLTYLKLTGMKLGYLLNFGDELMKNGITRIVNGLDNISPVTPRPLRALREKSQDVSR